MSKLQVHALGICEYIDPEKWGKDHKGTLLYAETRAVDGNGKLDPCDPHMRVDGTRYPTRLAGDIEVVGHDDYDCLRDAEAAGFLTYDEEVGLVKFTDAGWTYVHGLRRARAERALMRRA